MWLQAEALKELIARENDDGNLPTHPSIEVRACAEDMLKNPNPQWSKAALRRCQGGVFCQPFVMGDRLLFIACTNRPNNGPQPFTSQSIAQTIRREQSLCVPDARMHMGRLTRVVREAIEGQLTGWGGRGVLRCSVSLKATRTRRRCGGKRACGSS